MISGECIKIIGLDVNCFETNIIVEINVKNDTLEACKKNQRIICQVSKSNMGNYSV